MEKMIINDNGNDIILSDDEAKQFQKEKQELVKHIKSIEEEKAAKDLVRQSALAKLAELGLTAEEIAAL